MHAFFLFAAKYILRDMRKNLLVQASIMQDYPSFQSIGKRAENLQTLPVCEKCDFLL